MLDVVDQRCQNFFVDRREPAFQLFRVHAGINPGNGDHGEIDGGEDVRWRAQNDKWAEK